LQACSIKTAPALAAVVGGLVVPTSIYAACGAGFYSILDALPAFVGAGVVCLIQQKYGYTPKTLAGNLSLFGAYFAVSSATDALAQQLLFKPLVPFNAVLHGGLATGGSYLAFAAKNCICKK
jgi:hypothetical protein